MGQTTDKDSFEIEAFCLHATELAILVEIDGKNYWIPKSLIVHEESEVSEPGDRGTMVIPEWLAKDKGLI